jgi:hypothetical protein
MDMLSFIYGMLTVLLVAISVVSLVSLKMVLNLKRDFESFMNETESTQTHIMDRTSRVAEKNFDILDNRIQELKRDVFDEVRTNMRDTDYVDERLGIISSQLREEMYDLLVEIEKLKSK